MGYHVGEFTEFADLYRFWAKGYFDAGRRLVVSPKLDGVRMPCHRKGKQVRIFTEDKKRRREDYLPLTVKELLALPVDSIILDPEFVIYENGKPIPRREMITLIVGKEPFPEEGDLRVFIHDILWLNKDIHKEPYLKRMTALRKIIPKPLRRLRVIEDRVVSNKEELRRALEWAAKFPGSEGAMIRAADMEYDITGVSPRSIDMAKWKIIQEIKVQVIGILRKPLPWRSIKKDPPKEPLIGEEALKWYKKLAEKSETFLFRVAIRRDKKLVPLSAEAPLTPAELNLRWVVPGKPDPLTGKMVTGERGDWRGTNDPRIWKMGLGFKDRERGEPAYAVTYAIKLPGAKIGSIITVNPVLMRKWKDKAGKTHYSWTFPLVRDLDPTRELPDTVEDAERIVRATARKRKIKEALRPPWGHPMGKFSLAPQIAALIPKHKRYVEPMCGACHVLFYKEPSLKNVKITCEDVLKSIKRWDSRETFFYLDPPHLGLAGRVESFGQRKLIPITRLASALRGILGKFILSVPDTPEMRRDFAEFHKVSVETRRLVRPFSGARRRELLIANFPLKLASLS